MSVFEDRAPHKDASTCFVLVSLSLFIPQLCFPVFLVENSCFFRVVKRLQDGSFQAATALR